MTVHAAALVAAGVALLASSSGCHGGGASAARSVERDGAERAAHAGDDAATSGRLPEDPAAGQRSDAQWRQHMAAEELERELAFDRRKLAEHRGVMKLLAAARARYDRARNEAAVARVRAGMPAVRAALRERMTAIDHWGASSPLLKDYDAAMAVLEGAYPDARSAALKGDAQALRAVRADVDRRTRKMTDWLARAAASEDE